MIRKLLAVLCLCSSLQVYAEPGKDKLLRDGTVESSNLSYGNVKQYKIYTGSYNAVAVELASLSADLDLYVKRGSKPTETSYDCRPYKGGKQSELCFIKDVPLNSYVYIKVKAYESGSYDLRATLNSYASSSEVRIRNVGFLSQNGARNTKDGTMCRSENYLCGFVSANMLSSFYHGASPRLGFAQEMAENAVGNSCGSMSKSAIHAKSIKDVARAPAKNGWLPFDKLKEKLRANTPVSVTLTYGLLKNYRCSSFTGGHSVVVVGFSESRGEWIIHDPLCSSGYKKIPSDLFRNATNFTDNDDVDAIYIE